MQKGMAFKERLSGCWKAGSQGSRERGASHRFEETLCYR